MIETTFTLVRTDKSRGGVMTIMTYAMATKSSVGSCAIHKRRWKHPGFG